MTGPRKLLIMHDSASFGGHERMMIALLPGLFEAAAPFDDIAIALPVTNARLQDSLSQAFPTLRQIKTAFTKKRGEPYLRNFRFGYRQSVRRLIAAEKPDTVLLIQGRIENLAVPLSVIDAGVRIVSYLPMAHGMRAMGRSGTVGDRIRRPLYRRPDQFIVPSETVAHQLASAGSLAPVAVAHNVVSLPSRMAKATARALLDLPIDKHIALFIGRLDIRSKGIDMLLGAIHHAPAEALSNWTILFVGDGPEHEAIGEFAKGVAVDIRQVTWTDSPEMYLAASDIVLLPSRWEGVPLVMLEAMQYEVPILASDIDVYRQYLPAANICDFSRVDLPAMMERLTYPSAVDEFTAHCRAKLAPMTIEASQQIFTAAVAGVDTTGRAHA